MKNNHKSLRTVIFGAGGNARVIREILLLNGYNFIGFVSREPRGSIIDGYPLLCSIEDFISEYSSLNIEAGIVSIGDNFLRRKIAGLLEPAGIVFVNAVHPSAVVSPSVKFGKGIFVAAGAVIQPGVVINDHCFINTKASVDHDCLLEAFASIAPGATLCGSVSIGEETAVGPGAVIIEKVAIGKHCVVAANACVIQDFADYAMIMGNPARLKRLRAEGEKYLR